MEKRKLCKMIIDLGNLVTLSNINNLITRVLEEVEREKGQRIYLKKIIAENVPSLGKEIDI